MSLQILKLNQQQTLDRQEDVVALASRVFGTIEAEYIGWRIRSMPDLTTFVATTAATPGASPDTFGADDWMGFKCGYGMTQRRYYSWLGGVAPEGRGLGTASELMRAQHQWLQATPYEVVETHVRQDNVAMVKTNQKFGFKIVGRFLKSNQVNLIMQASVR